MRLIDKARRGRIPVVFDREATLSDGMQRLSNAAAIFTTGYSTRIMPLLEVEGLLKRFVRRRPFQPAVVVHAVNDVSFTVDEGESFGLVGTSGSGKTTAARCILRLTTPTAGQIRFDGEPIGSMSRQQLR